MQSASGPAHEAPQEALEDALARLRGRWGTAAIRLGNGAQAAPLTHGALALAPAPLTHGALALAPVPDLAPGLAPDLAPGLAPDLALASVPDLAPGLAPHPYPAPRRDPLDAPSTDVVSTGFPALDAVLGPGGLPRHASAAIRGDASSGKTTLALRCVAEAQIRGAIAAWLDLPAAFDPIEALARGVDPRWLLVVRPTDLGEGLAICGTLLSGRAVDLLVVDLPAVLQGHQETILRRLSAHARRVGASLLVLEPPTLHSRSHSALAEVTGLRLELEREAWIRSGRDVVGQQTCVTVAKNRFGPPGRRVTLGIHYLDEGERAMGTHRFAAP